MSDSSDRYVRTLLRDEFAQKSWSDFCLWLEGKRVATETEVEGLAVDLEFEDGSRAVLVSNHEEPTVGYSEYTPGDDGHILPPTVYVKASPEPTHDVEPVASTSDRSATIWKPRKKR